MIRAVFFDLYHTIVRYEPPRELLEAEALAESGITRTPEELRRPLAAADEFIYAELARMPMGQRDKQDAARLWARYQQVLLQEAGIAPEETLVLGLLQKMKEARMEPVLFNDVLPVLTGLSRRGLITGLISNIDRDITAMLTGLGLTELLRIIVTSRETGATKPSPEIFRVALARAAVLPEEAVYVGDQYHVDVVGAKNAGMKGILLDRAGLHPEITDAPRIRGLEELTPHLQSS
jgi:putative hydrolase of the HAD superfamily